MFCFLPLSPTSRLPPSPLHAALCTRGDGCLSHCLPSGGTDLAFLPTLSTWHRNCILNAPLVTSSAPSAPFSLHLLPYLVTSLHGSAATSRLPPHVANLSSLSGAHPKARRLAAQSSRLLLCVPVTVATVVLRGALRAPCCGRFYSSLPTRTSGQQESWNMAGMG